MTRTCTAATAAFLLACTALCAQPTRFKPGFNLFSKKQDVQLGREAAAEIAKQKHIVQDNALQAYLNRVGRRLAASPQTDSADFDYTFRLVQDPEVNAFALPGGFTFVNTGLVLAVQNEAQLAAVMAHEMAHVALRHGTNQASKRLGFRLALGIVGLSGGSLLQQIGGLGASGVLLKFSRTDERQADLLGLHIMADAGYDPIEMARFFETLKAEGGSHMPEWLSSHPDTANRIADIENEIRRMPRRNYTNGAGDFSAMQRRVRALTGKQKAR